MVNGRYNRKCGDHSAMIVARFGSLSESDKMGIWIECFYMPQYIEFLRNCGDFLGEENTRNFLMKMLSYDNVATPIISRESLISVSNNINILGIDPEL